MFNHPKLFMALAIVMMLLGIVLPFLIILKILESTFFLNFLSYALSTFGMFLGMISLVSLRKEEK